MDLAAPSWRAYLLKRAAELRKQGYAGLFLDTLDSFQLQAEERREGQRRALASFLAQLHRQEPGLKLFFNRGFEVLPELPGVASAVAVESIHAGWDAAAGQYREVPQDDRDWLKGHLDALRAQGMPIVAIDYLPPERRDEARTLAARLRSEGYVPFVSTPALDYLGVSDVEVQPRRIALLYDPREGDLTLSPGHVYLGGLLEYLGYRVDYLPTDQPLPERPLSGLYAGVVTWMTSVDRRWPATPSTTGSLHVSTKRCRWRSSPACPQRTTACCSAWVFADCRRNSRSSRVPRPTTRRCLVPSKRRW